MKPEKALPIFVAALFIIAISGCINTQADATTLQGIVPHNDITVQEAKDMIDNDKDVLILDVRTEAEFAMGHLAGAINIPYYEIEERHAELNAGKDKPIITVCPWGGSSRSAAEKLSQLGFTNVNNMFEGLNTWHKVYGEFTNG